MSSDSNIMDLKSFVNKKFQEFKNKYNGNLSKDLLEVKKSAIDKFFVRGLPTKKNEEWKYTNVSFLDKFKFDTSKYHIDNTYRYADFLANRIKNQKDFNLIVFINGLYCQELGNLIQENGLTILPLSMAISEKDIHLISNFSKIADMNNPFTLMNTASANDGIYISISEANSIKNPIVIINISDSSDSEKSMITRNFINLGENSRLELFEMNYSYGSRSNFNNLVTEINIRSNSSLSFTKYHNESASSKFIGETAVRLGKSSRFSSNTIIFSDGFCRNDLNVLLEGEHSEAEFNGMYIGSDNSFIDNHTLADHIAPNCNSNELYKGILDGESEAVFNGKIIVRNDAQKTNAYQSNKNILLSDKASINTKPQLEIYADDVKCSHGATSGSIDKDSIFYLQSRGIGIDNAKALLLKAFALEIVSKVENESIKGLIQKDLISKLNLDSIFTD